MQRYCKQRNIPVKNYLPESYVIPLIKDTDKNSLFPDGFKGNMKLFREAYKAQ
jgi:hypothetical protein